MTFIVEVKDGCVVVYKKEDTGRTEIAKFFTIKAITYARKFMESLK